MNNLSKRSRMTLCAVGAVVLLLLIVYLVGISHYKKRLLPGTWLNGVDCSGMTAEEAGEELQKHTNEYRLLIHGRNGAEAQVSGEAIGLTYVDNGNVQRLIEEQSAASWMFRVGRHIDEPAELNFSYNAEILQNQVSAFSFLQPENMEPPVSAHVGDDGQNFVVVPETEGYLLDYGQVLEAISQAVITGAASLDFDEKGLYAVPAVRADAPELKAQADLLNQYASLIIVYDFVDRQFVADRGVIRSWMAPDENNNYALSSDLVAQWVYNMAYETDTFANSHLFTTHSGQQIMLAPGGDYGWAMDQEETTAALIQAVQQMYSGNLEPSYVYTAQDRSSNDIGGTYVEVCIEEQMAYLFEDYQLKVATPVITGCHNTGFDTPSGSVWAIDGKKYQMQFTLFDVEVEYWLPFNGDCGLHDAHWRTDAEYMTPGYYLNGGSHGCVNTPYDAMETMFNTVEIGYPVIVYYSAYQPVGPEPTQDVTVG